MNHEISDNRRRFFRQSLRIEERIMASDPVPSVPRVNDRRCAAEETTATHRKGRDLIVGPSPRRCRSLWFGQSHAGD